MRRVLIVLAVVAMLVASAALPALAIPPTTTPGQFTCVKFDPNTGQVTEVDRVPRGQIAIYEAAGYFCYRGQ